MVIHEDESEPPTEEPVRRRSDRSKYVVVRNHVRELRATQDIPTASDSQQKRRKRANNSTDEDALKSISEESSDLEELRRVYLECKRVLNVIETKYGHRLNLDVDDTARDYRQKRQKVEGDNAASACTCPKNKKIIFDEDGLEAAASPARGDHVCVARPAAAQRVSVEAEGEHALPESIAELAEMLRDRRLASEVRRAAVERMRALRTDLNNELRYHRHSLVERMKRCPDEELAFVGTNLSSLPGYVYL